MMTVRQIERQWESRRYEKLSGELLAGRPRAGVHSGVDFQIPSYVAALAVIRLDELSQSHVPLYSKLVRAILSAQEADGGWGDVAGTALCLRALFCGDGNGSAIDRGLKYLADLQKSEGLWPAVPIRRMPADAHLSASVLFQLGDQAAFRQAVRIDDALNWFAANEATLDRESRTLWNHARSRCGRRSPLSQPCPSLC